MGVAISLFVLQALSVNGQVRDAVSSEPVLGAWVILRCGNTETRAPVGPGGTFAMSASQDATGCRLVVEALGYQTHARSLSQVEGTLNVALEPVPFVLDGVTASLFGEASVAALPGDPGSFRVSPEILTRVDGFVESDVIRGLAALPEISFPSDFSSAPLLRGGSPGESEVRLDGIRLPNPYHAAGFVSSLAPELVGTAVVQTASSRWAPQDRLAGSIRIETRDGRRDGHHATGRLGLLSASLSVDGPLPLAGSSYLGSIRRSWVDQAVRLARRAGVVETDYPHSFHDAQGKVTFDRGGTWRFTGSGYRNREHVDGAFFGIDLGNANRWGTALFSVAGVGRFSNGWTLDTKVGWSRFSGTFGADQDGALSKTSSVTRTVAVALSKRRGALQVRGDVDVTRTSHDHTIRAESVPFVDRDLRISEPLTRSALGGEVSYRSSDIWTTTVASRWMVVGTDAVVWVPSAQIAIQAHPRVEFTAAVARRAQPWVSLRNEESVISRVVGLELEIPAASDQSPQTSREVSIGALLTGSRHALRVGLFHRSYHELLMPRPHGDANEAPFLVPPEELVQGSGSSAGVEVAGSLALRGVLFQAAYAGVRVRRDVAGASFPPAWDRAHRVDMRIGWTGAMGRVGATIHVASGQPTTPWVGFLPNVDVDSNGRPVLPGGRLRHGILGSRNSARLPAYVRLDLTYEKEWNTGWFGLDGAFSIEAGLLNLVNTRNVLLLELDDFGSPSVAADYQLPLLPALEFRWAF